MIKYLITHPIQYQAPLFRFLSKRLNFSVIFRSDFSIKKSFDPTFNKNILLDKNLLSGYQYDFLDHIGPNKVSNIFPLTTQFSKKIFTKETKIICIHGIKIWFNIIIIILAKIKKKKVFIREELNNLKKRSILNIFLNKVYFFIIDKFIDCYLSAGKQSTKTLIYYGVNKKKIFLLPYCVNNKKFKTKIPKKFTKITILFTGKLIYRKGCDLLLNAIKDLNTNKKFKKDVKVKIVGDGPLLKKLKEFKKKNNLDNVKFLGFKDQELIKHYYKNSNLFIMPSREENWGLALNEAMASKNIVIASNKVSASYDLIINNKNGYTFINNNYVDLSKKIMKIYKNKKSDNVKLSSNSEKIISKWSFNEFYIGLSAAINYVLKAEKSN
mgnify:FL=1